MVWWIFTYYRGKKEKSLTVHSILLSGVLRWLLPTLATGIERWSCRHGDFLPHVGACGTLKHPCLLERLQRHPAPQEITSNHKPALMDIAAQEGTPLTALPRHPSHNRTMGHTTGHSLNDRMSEYDNAYTINSVLAPGHWPVITAVGGLCCFLENLICIQETLQKKQYYPRTFSSSKSPLKPTMNQLLELLKIPGHLKGSLTLSVSNWATDKSMVRKCLDHARGYR